MKFVALLSFCLSYTAATAQKCDSCVYVINESDTASVYITKMNAFQKGSFPHVLSPGEASVIPMYTSQPSYLYFKVQRNARDYIAYPGDTIRVTAPADVPLIKTNDSKKNRQAEFMNAFYTAIIEMDDLKIEPLSKTMTLEARDEFFNRTYNRALDFIDKNIYKYSSDEWFIRQCRRLAFYKMVINKYEKQVYRYKYADGIKQFYQKEFARYVDSFDADIKGHTYEVRKAALAVNSVLANSDDPIVQYRHIHTAFRDRDVKNFLKTKIVYDLLIANNNGYKNIIGDFYKTDNDPSIIAAIKELEALKSNSIELNSNETVLLDKTGKKLTFSSVMNTLQGKVVYVDFWASWCMPCKREMPYSEKLRQKFAGKNVVFLYISADEDFKAWADELKSVKLQQHPFSYVFSDPYHSHLAKQLKINSYPRYVIFDMHGKLIDSDAKRPSDADLEKKLRSLIN